MTKYEFAVMLVIGALTGFFAWASVQPWNHTGWASAMVAGICFACTVRAALIDIARSGLGR